MDFTRRFDRPSHANWDLCGASDDVRCTISTSATRRVSAAAPQRRCRTPEGASCALGAHGRAGANEASAADPGPSVRAAVFCPVSYTTSPSAAGYAGDSSMLESSATRIRANYVYCCVDWPDGSASPYSGTGTCRATPARARAGSQAVAGCGTRPTASRRDTRARLAVDSERARGSERSQDKEIAAHDCESEFAGP